MIPEMPGCGAPAVRRIEAYSARNGMAHGSLDGSLYACEAHREAFTDLLRGAGLTVYVVPGDLAGPVKRCGDGMDFTAPDRIRILYAPALAGGVG